MFASPRVSARLVTPALLLVCLLAACSAAPAPSLPSPIAKASLSPAPQTPEPGGAPLVITTTNGPDPQRPEEIARHDQLVTAFHELRPDVTVEAHPGVFDKALFSDKLADGTMEDAFLVAFTEPQELIASGNAADITELIKGWDNYYSLNPDVLTIVQSADNHIYGVPVGGYALGLLYNRKLFAAAGLDPDRPPTTWAELQDYARRLTDDAVGRKGFAELSAGNQGGWHFTAWSYSFGGDMERRVDGRWTATFDAAPSVQALTLLHTMRWDDRSVAEQPDLNVDAVLQLMADERVAMAIMAPDALPALGTRFGGTVADFGLGPLPQSGANSTLAGGSAWIFNPHSAPEVRRAAFEWAINRDFNLVAYEADLQGQRARGELVGWPQLPLFGGDFQAQREQILARYANAPVANYTAYTMARLRPRPEPPIATQRMYEALDAVMRSVLTDASADPQSLLANAAQTFNREVLAFEQR